MTKLKHKDNLVWLDMEMTGLNYQQNVIIEVAVVITDAELNILDQTPSYAIYQPDSELQKMDKWNVKTHTKSGLVDRVRSSTLTLAVVEKKIVNFIKKYVYKNQSPLCGNTIYQDRKFIIKYMPLLEDFLHYRLVDVSTLKELARRWYPAEIANGFVSANCHQALSDVLESIEELKYYRQKLLIPSFALPGD